MSKIQIDPIIAVSNVGESSQWYQSLLGCRSMHGGDTFEVLVSKDDEILLCLHPWGAHAHPTMINPDIAPGNGLILYFRVENMDEVRNNVTLMENEVEEEVHVNPNSTKREFSLRDPDGYYVTITEFHRYEG